MKSRFNTSTLAAVALVCTFAATEALAGDAYRYSSDTGEGVFISHDWTGGDMENLEAAMQYAMNRGGSFNGMDTRRNQVNMFMVDFTTDPNSNLFGAGLTLFVVWGNDNEADGDFVGTVDLSPSITEGEDNGTYSGSHIFALGDSVTIDDDGPLTVDIDVSSADTPIGFAVTNINGVEGQGERGMVNLQFTLAQAIRKARLMGAAAGTVWQGMDDDGSDNIFTDGIVLSVVPGPPAAMLGLLGLGGLAISRRRRG